MDKTVVEYIQVEYYSVIENKGILPFVTKWMDLEGIMLSEVRQIEKDKYCMTSYVKYKNKTKANTNNNKKKKTHRKRDQTCGNLRWRVKGGGIGGRWSKGKNFPLQD